MKILFYRVVGLLIIVVSAQASDKSILTKVTESVSSSSYSKVECSMEDYTCQKIILDMGRQEALSRVFSDEQGKLSVVLQQSIAILRSQNSSLVNFSDEQILSILASQEQ